MELKIVKYRCKEIPGWFTCISIALFCNTYKNMALL